MSRVLAIFDVDGTLVPRPGMEMRFARFLLARGVLNVPRLLGYVARLPVRLWRDGRLALKTNKAYLAGLESHRLVVLADHFIDQAGPRLWYQPALARLWTHQQRGDSVLLLTGTPDFLADALARRLGADGYEASVLARRNGRVTAAPPLQHPFGAKKLAAAERVAVSRGADLSTAWAYGDAWADRFLLAAVGHAVAVRPGRHLRQLAAQSGWEILDKKAAGPERSRGPNSASRRRPDAR